MTITSIKPPAADHPGAAATRPPSAATDAFAIVARKIAAQTAAGDPAPSTAPRAANEAATPAQTPAGASLGVILAALARMGAQSRDAAAADPTGATPAGAAGRAAQTRSAAASGDTRTVVDVTSPAGKDEPANASPLPPLEGQDLRDMLKLQTGSFNPSLYERLGANYSGYVNAYGAGGYYYDPTAIALAGMSGAELAQLKSQYASPQQWLTAHGVYANAVSAAPASWDEIEIVRPA